MPPPLDLRRFARRLGLVAALLAVVPVLIGWLTRPAGSTYLPFHMSLDDHMVYAAWMRQAMEGSFLFDNRFTVAAQPGLTVNLYFLVLGWVAKVFGITLTLSLARVALSYIVCVLLGKFISHLELEERTSKFALALAVFGGGLAWVSWQTFGTALADGPAWFSSLLGGAQPIDNWQPEGFLFPSMLTNGLFLAAGCLILVTLTSILKCRESWKPVLPGAVAFFLLMNIHSYDILLVAMVLVAFLAGCAFNKLVTKAWLLRASVICAAAVPPALWFFYVLQSDAVFQSRAATPTFSAHPIHVGAGIFLLAPLSFFSIRAQPESLKKTSLCVALLLTITIFFVLITPAFDVGLMSPPAWTFVYCFVVLSAIWLSSKNLALNLVWSWACVSLIAPYFPALFQRKLTMLIALPWGILAAIGLVTLTQNLKKPIGPLIQYSLALVACLSSVLWLARDVQFVRGGVSRTLVHNLYLDKDETEILAILSRIGYGKNVLNMPGIMHPSVGQPAYLSDFGPALSGLAGAHTFAGHWSETPSYNDVRNAATQFFIERWPDDRRMQFLYDMKIDFVVAPTPSAYRELPLQDLSGIGELIYKGDRLQLIRVSK